MNRQIRQLAAALIALYVMLFVALNYWQVNRTEELASEPGNTRALIRQFDTPRGADHHRRRRRGRPQSCRRPATATSSSSATTRPATCSPTSPATPRSGSAPPSSNRPSRACSPATRSPSRSAPSTTCFSSDQRQLGRAAPHRPRRHAGASPSSCSAHARARSCCIEVETGAVIAMWS